ncbi:MAG: hypothetical protein HQ515_15545 [Phycisphaeraceae bacterium]|nr:hypothetical protein [Phycisphaeraceae bacterium]
MHNKMTIEQVRQESGNSMSIHTLRSVFGRVLFGIAFTLLCSLEARAQFIVQPMQINIQCPAGSTVRRQFKLENRDKFESHYVAMSIVDLIQDRDSSWTIYDSEMLTESNSGFDFDVHSSCKDWISLRRSEVIVDAFDSETENLEIRVPSRAKGFSCAGLRVTLEPRPGLGGVAIRYDFVVPICITIEGRALRSDVKLVSSGLKFVEAKDDKQESTSVVVTIKNEGGAHSMLTPVVSILQILASGTRSVVRDLALSDVAIIPGAEIDLRADLQSSLPTGRYRIVTRMSVDGRRVPGMTEEIAFKNPGVSGPVHQRGAIRLLPGQIDLEQNPGRTASQQIVVRNDSDEHIVVKAIPVMPETMAGKILNVRGEDMSCVDWTEVRPTEFSIRAGAERKVTVVTRMPAEDKLPAVNEELNNFYGTIKFYGFYRDHSSAGMASAFVNVKKMGGESTPFIQARNLTIKSLDGTKALVVGAFANLGTVHVVPTCSAQIESQENGILGTPIRYGGRLALKNVDADKNLMPLETRQFSAEVDFSDIPEGKYIVTATISYGLGASMFKQSTRMFEVYESNGEKQIFLGENTRPVASSGG